MRARSPSSSAALAIRSLSWRVPASICALRRSSATSWLRRSFSRVNQPRATSRSASSSRFSTASRAPQLLEARHRRRVPARQETQRPDRRQERLAGREREQHPEIAVAAHPVEAGEPQPQAQALFGQAPFEVGDRRLGGGGALLGDRLRRLGLGDLLSLELELELEPLELAGNARRRLLHRLEPGGQPGDLAADRLQLLLARRGRGLAPPPAPRRRAAAPDRGARRASSFISGSRCLRCPRRPRSLRGRGSCRRASPWAAHRRGRAGSA